MGRKKIVGILAGIGVVAVTVAVARKIAKIADACDKEIFEDDIFEYDEEEETPMARHSAAEFKSLQEQIEKLRKQREDLLYAVYVDLPITYKKSEENAVKKALKDAGVEPKADNATGQNEENNPKDDTTPESETQSK